MSAEDLILVFLFCTTTFIAGWTIGFIRRENAEDRARRAYLEWYRNGCKPINQKDD